MNTQTYHLLEAYMLQCMNDSAHDKDHIYRVLYVALDIAQYETAVDYDVLIAACLLHDIGRPEQFADPAVCHALAGGEKAHRFLIENGYAASFAAKVKACIETHRFRANRPPQSTEAKILFDADKVDVTGTLGIARTIFYKGEVSEPLYTLDADGKVSDGTGDAQPSFFQEYKYKMENLYGKFYTVRGAAIAADRQASAVSFYENMLREVRGAYERGQGLLNSVVNRDAING